MKRSVLVLGGTGMLGSMVTDYLARQPGLQVTATARDAALAAACSRRLDAVGWHAFDFRSVDLTGASELLAGCDWVINCIGILKPLIRDDNSFEVERAVRVNTLLPHLLAQATLGGARVLQIATDCAYSGTRGGYRERDPHDALDVYGKTKSLGEVQAGNFHHLRCSIIGPEAGTPKSLLEWFLSQPNSATVNGFVNHHWNGVTTLQFARLCQGVIEKEVNLPPLQHVVPRGSVTKCAILERFAECYDRSDIRVTPTEAAVVVDRTLNTENEPQNLALWAAAGYTEPPDVLQMIEELAHFDYRWKSSLPALASTSNPPRQTKLG